METTLKLWVLYFQKIEYLQKQNKQGFFKIKG